MENDVTRAFHEMHRKQRANLAKSFGYDFEDSVEKSKQADKLSNLSSEQREIVKALASDNPFDREYGEQLLQKADLSEIEKSDIMDAISYCSNDGFIFKKTGKEIKDKINTILLPEKQAKLAATTTEVETILSDCGEAPTADVPRYWLNDINMDLGYKIYHWEECHLPCKNECISDSLSWEHQSDKPKANTPQTEDECKARNKYNSLVERMCQITVDIKACEILNSNLKDEDSIKMTPRQLAVFRFV
jgi:hypothetical protein